MSDKKTNKSNKNNGKKKQKFSVRHPKIALTIKILILIIVMVAVVGAGIVVGMLYGVWGQDLEITQEELTISGNSVVLDTDGKVIAELSGDENRKIITFKEMPEKLRNAYIAIEDERFHKHYGVDFKRTAAAIATYVFNGGSSSFGGSTITQQLVKNITQDDEDTGIEGVTRKVKEWAKAYQIERMLSKDQIIELYLNIIFVGGGNYGVEAGASYYFNKTAKKLSLAECAFLAGINHAPNAYNPYGDYPYGENQSKTDKINNRTKTVLSKMLECEYINQEEYDKACKKVDKGLKFKKSNKKGKIYSYHTEATIAQLINDIMKEKGVSKEYATTYLYGGGLTIYSTQDSNVQEDMEKVMEYDSSKYVETSRKTKDSKGNYVTSQSSMVVIDNKTGYVAGCIGGLGEKTTNGDLNRATQSVRQTGSSIKPLADLIPGIEEGIINPATVYNDNYTVFTGEYAGGKYTPKNYNGYKGYRNLRQATTTSQNIPFVKSMVEITPPVAREYLREMGITSLSDKEDNGLSLSIGGLYTGISTLEMAAAYATIANDGEYREPLFYTEVKDADGKTVLKAKQEKREVFSKQTAYIVKDMLTSVVTDAGATASYCRISGIDVAAKTGTTNGDVDRWLCGFTNYYSGATWYGYDKNKEKVRKTTNPAGQIYSAVMKSLHLKKKKSKFEKPDGIVTLKVCNSTGLKATSKCSKTHYEIFVKGKEPGTCKENSKGVEVCKDTELLANKYCPDTKTIYASALPPKEDLGLWKTNKSKSNVTVPEEECEEHSKESLEKYKPTIKLKGKSSMTLKVGEIYSEKGATAKDKFDGDLTEKIVISGSVNTSKAGTYTITYTVTNSYNKTTTATRTITVKEDKAEDTNTNNTNDANTNNTNTGKDETEDNSSKDDKNTTNESSTQNNSNTENKKEESTNSSDSTSKPQTNDKPQTDAPTTNQPTTQSVEEDKKEE